MTKQLTPKQAQKVQRDATIALDVLSGMKYADIATKHGLDKSWICKILKKEHIAQILNEGYNRYALMTIDVINQFNNILQSGEESSKVALIKEFNKNMGFSPAHTQNIFIQQLYQDNRQVNIAPEVQRVIDSVMSERVPEAELIEE